MTVPTTAQIHRLCCDWNTYGEVGNPQRARWELYVVVYNTTATWPSFQWPVSKRHTIPTPAERVEALARLGYQPAPGAEWEWQESETPAYHDHPSAVSMLGTIRIVPLDQDGGDGS